MKIIKVIHGYPPAYNAGSEVYSQSICECLAKSHQVHVFTREQDEYSLDFSTRTETRNGIPLTIINLAREKDGYEHPLVNAAFRKLLCQFQPDVVHIGHLNHLSLGIVREAENAGIPIVFTLHDFWLLCPRGQFLQRNFDGRNLYRLCTGQEDRKCAVHCYKMIHSCQLEDEEKDTAYWTDWIRRRMEAVGKIIPLVDFFVAPSRYLKQRFANNSAIPDDRIIYLDYGFPTMRFRNCGKQADRPFTFGYIGTHIPAKGVNLLIAAFKELEEKACLKIWGRNQGQNTASLKRLAASCKNIVEFEGEYQNENIVQAVFEHVDAIVVPSIWCENSPLVIHEAQACGIPVITADFGGMKEYVEHQGNGLLFEHRNKADLTMQLQYAIRHPDVMKQLGQKGYLYSADGRVPDVATHCNKLIQIYKKAIQKYETIR